MNLREEILKLTNSAPTLDKDDQNLSDDETTARVSEYKRELLDNDDVDGDDEYISRKRIRPFIDLAEYSDKYKGQIIKRSKLNDDFNDDDDDDGGDDGDDEDIDGTISDNETDRSESENEDETYSDDDDDDEETETLPQNQPNQHDNDSNSEELKLLNTESLNKEFEKSQIVKLQLNYWDSLLETRIKLQNCINNINQYPNNDELEVFLSDLNKDSLPIYNENETILCNIFNQIINLLNFKNKKQQKLKYSQMETYLNDEYKNYTGIRNEILNKWHEKTSLLSNVKGMNSLEKPIIQQIENLLKDKERIIKRTQLKRSIYSRLTKQQSNNETNDIKNLKDYDTEIFDDYDLYQQFLRSIINQKSQLTTNPIELSRNNIDLMKIKSNKKKIIDTKASKGRKLRFDVHKQLVNFMAPIYKNLFTENAKNDLFSALFSSNVTFGE